MTLSLWPQPIQHSIDVTAATARAARSSDAVERGRDLFARPAARPEQWAAALGRKSVAVHHDEIDIGRSLRNFFRQQKGSLVDHSCQRAVLDLFGREDAP